MATYAASATIDAARLAFLALIPLAPRAVGKKRLANASPLTEQWVETFLAELLAAGKVALGREGWSRQA